ncbi:MAG: RidA family protein [Hyphomicrobiales bacterium]|nr:RidA family protein [Hyphomicrobiales bacterium]
MSGNVEARLKELQIELPAPAAPAANYVPYTIAGTQLFVSGQLPMGPDGLAYTGKLGADVDEEAGQAAARLCAINILAQAKDALGDLDRIAQCLKLGGFVNAVPDFSNHPKIINGASDLIVEVLGEKGRHARFAVGAGGLPLDAAVEVDAVFAFT